MCSDYYILNTSKRLFKYSSLITSTRNQLFCITKCKIGNAECVHERFKSVSLVQGVPSSVTNGNLIWVCLPYTGRIIAASHIQI